MESITQMNLPKIVVIIKCEISLELEEGIVS